ncbi:MAG: hypothetical protein AAF934_06530 [Bacteroidota bacterium]
MPKFSSQVAWKRLPKARPDVLQRQDPQGLGDLAGGRKRPKT